MSRLLNCYVIVVMLNIVMPSVVRLNVVMLSVVAPGWASLIKIETKNDILQ